MEINNYLEKEELKYLLETLVFSIATDICSEWTDEDYDKMLSLIEKLSKAFDNKVKLDNVYLSKGAIFEDKKLVNKIKKFVKIKIK